jgi:hypothetical protein
MLNESKSYPQSIIALFVLIGAAILFSSCAPTPTYSAPPKQTGRCLVMISATWCEPCSILEKHTFPKLKANGLTIADYRDRQQADVHVLKIDKDADPRRGWKIDDEKLPCLVVWENGKILTCECGSFDESSFYRLLDRDDLKPNGRAPVPIADQITIRDDAVSRPQPGQSAWDQLIEQLGTDTATITLQIPKGRRIEIPDANAAATIPETLTGHIRALDKDTVELKFDEPLVKAEGKRYGIRIGTVIPKILLTRDQVTVQTGLGIPIRWKLESHPFGTSSLDPAEAAAIDP